MALDFLESELYLKLFPLKKLSDKMTEKAYELFGNNRDLLGLSSRKDDVKVVSIGFNMGARDVAVVVGLAKALASSKEDKNTRLPEIHVLAIDPATVKRGIADRRDFLTDAKFFRKETPGDTPEIWQCEEPDQAKIKVEIVGQTAEAWIESQTSESRRQWDVVLSCAVLHLLTDWKTTLDFFLRNLMTNGIFMFVEATGNVGAFEGDFRSGVPAGDTWSKLWHAMTELRAHLLLPSSKVVSPGDMSFLASTLESINYTKLHISAEEPCIDVTTEETLRVDEIRQLIETVKEGPDAKTLGAFRIYDRDRAQQFVAKALEKFSELRLSGGESITFNTGTKIHAYLKLEPARGNCCLSEAVAHSAWACAQAEVLERKSSIKRALGHVLEVGSTQISVRTSQAIATLLFDMRETLALSRDTLLVLARRRGDKYTEAFQLPPLSLIGKESSASVDAYLATMTAYVNFNKTKHFSELLNISNIGDLTVCIDTRNPGNENRSLSLSVRYAADGSPSFVQLNVSEEIFVECRSKLMQCVPSIRYGVQHIGEEYEGWDQENGFTRFFVEPSLKESSDSSPNEEAESFIENIVNDEIKKKVEEALEDKCSQWTKIQRESIANVLSYTLRLAWVEWRNSNDELPPWRTCYYFARKNTLADKTRMSVGLLLLVSEKDQKAWEGLSDRLTKHSSSKLPVLVSAIEPFLSSIQEIRVPELATISAFKIMKDLLGHELSKIYSCAMRALESVDRNENGGCNAQVFCRFAMNLAKSALMYGTTWATSNNRDILSDKAYAFGDSGNAKWGNYAREISRISWQLFLGNCIIFDDYSGITDTNEIKTFNSLWECDISSALKILNPDKSFKIPNEKFDYRQINVDIYRWFLVAMTNTWKHSVFLNNSHGKYSTVERMYKAREIISNQYNLIDLDAKFEDNKMRFEISNRYSGKDRDPMQKFSLDKTARALMQATDELRDNLELRNEAVKCEFFGKEENCKWFTRLYLDFS